MHRTLGRCVLHFEAVRNKACGVASRGKEFVDKTRTGHFVPNTIDDSLFMPEKEGVRINC